MNTISKIPVQELIQKYNWVIMNVKIWFDKKDNKVKKIPPKNLKWQNITNRGL